MLAAMRGKILHGLNDKKSMKNIKFDLIANLENQLQEVLQFALNNKIIGIHGLKSVIRSADSNRKHNLAKNGLNKNKPDWIFNIELT